MARGILGAIIIIFSTVVIVVFQLISRPKKIKKVLFFEK